MPESWPLIGRSEVLAELVELAKSGSRAGAVVVGPPGVGRTRIARAAVAAVVDATGSGREHGWAPRWIMADASTADIPLGALSHLLPEPTTATVPAELLRDARRQLLEQAGSRRLVLAVDDVHVLDATSAVLLRQLAIADEAFLVLTAPTAVPVPNPVFALWKEGLTEVLEVPPLTPDQCDHLAAEVLGDYVDRAALRRLWTLSLGIPLLLRELVEGGRASGALRRVGPVWRWDGPLDITPRLVEVVNGRMGNLSEDEHDLLGLLAFGQPLGIEVATVLASPETLASVERRGMVTSSRAGRRVEVRLRHPLHTEVLRRQATPLQEREAHHRLTTALESRGARRADDRTRLLAWRIAQGTAADTAELLSAAHEILPHDRGLAERFLRAAVGQGGDDATRYRLAQTLVHVGLFAEAEEVLAAPARAGPGTLSWTTMRVLNLYWGLRDLPRAEEILAGLEDSGATGSPTPEVLALHALHRLLGGRVGDAVAVVDRLELLRAPPTDEAALTVLAVSALVCAKAGFTARARDHAERGMGAPQVHPMTHPWLLFVLRAARWYADLQAGDLDGAEAAASRCHEEALGAGLREHVALYGTWLGIVAGRRGKVRTAARWLHEAAAGVSSARFSFAAPLIGELAIALACDGRHRAAADVLAEAETLVGGGVLDGWTYSARAWLEGTSGRHSRALEIALTACAEAETYGHRLQALHVAVRLGAAKPVADALTALAEQGDGHLPGVYAAHARALAKRDGVGLDAVAEQFSELGFLLLAAEAAAQASAAHRTEGHTGSARSSAARARRWADRCEGAHTPALDLLDAAVELTRREREIASLAATGMTSRTIAVQLVVSVRTVDNVLRSVYAKLGIAGRGELPAVVGLPSDR